MKSVKESEIKVNVIFDKYRESSATHDYFAVATVKTYRCNHDSGKSRFYLANWLNSCRATFTITSTSIVTIATQSSTCKTSISTATATAGTGV